MWQYRNTDELYHANIYKNMNKKSNHELYHSDVYLGKDYSDGIKHWKYIKRIKMANGKWRYIYKDEKGDNLHQQSLDEYSKGLRASAERDNIKGNSILDEDKRRALNSQVKFHYDMGNNIDKKYKIHKVLSAPRRSVEKGIGKAANILSDFNDKYKIKQKIKQRIDSAINKIKNRKNKR